MWAFWWYWWLPFFQVRGVLGIFSELSFPGWQAAQPVVPCPRSASESSSITKAKSKSSLKQSDCQVTSTLEAPASLGDQTWWLWWAQTSVWKVKMSLMYYSCVILFSCWRLPGKLPGWILQQVSSRGNSKQVSLEGSKRWRQNWKHLKPSFGDQF